MGRPREHGDTTRRALLDAAERLIDENGPDGASVRAVADAVGTTTRAVYSIFGSKQGLLEALATRLFEMLSDAIDAVPTTDDAAADVVEVSIRAFRRTALEHPSLYSLVFLRIVPDLQLGPPTYVAVASAAFARLEALVERVDLGRDRQARDAAHAVHALTEGLASMELRGNMLAPDIAEAVWRDALSSLLLGFGSTSTARPTNTRYDQSASSARSTARARIGSRGDNGATAG